MDEASIFLEALQKCTPEKRDEYLEQACAGNSGMRRSVEMLLKAHAKAGEFLSRAAPDLLTTAEIPITEGPGTAIGPYKLMEQIGEGGMGLVFVAEQQHPVRRKVALKVIKPGMDTRQIIARFEAERQVLALMDHPHIAKVLDGGETGSGRPYFVMELVKGVPVTEYCDQNQLPVRERLELFIEICHAVQHAHQKGIIHRDIKPSNVLVVSHDGRPVIKVIDFGVAKAIGQQLTDKTIYTQFAQLIGTPLYMSPEQAGLSGLDIDTRSDIYALGVLLYELLTGTTPFDNARFKTAAYDEIRRIIREEEPPKPSTRISTLGEAATTISAQRKSEPRRLRQLCRGELDWIVMKALEKDRNRRYESASALAADVHRYLADEPVQACPPSAVYWFRKFARRKRGTMITAALLTSALLITFVVLAISNFIVIRERNEKTQALDDREIALGNERAARNDLEKTKEELEVSLYFQIMGRAQREREAGNVGLAEALLDDPRFFDLRDWEWHYLKRLRYGSPRPLAHSGPVKSLSVSPDGKLLAAASGDKFYIWDARSGRAVLSLPAHSQAAIACHARFSPDGQQLAIVAAGQLTLWDTTTWKPVRVLASQEKRKCGCLAFSPNGQFLAVAYRSTGPAVGIWDLATGQERLQLPGRNDVDALAFSPDGNRLASDSAEHLQVWDVQTGQIVRRIAMDGGLLLRDAAFSPDGRYLAVAGGDMYLTGERSVVRIWDADTGALVHDLKGHVGIVNCLAFSPDSRRLVSGASEDRAIKVWDVRSGKEALTLRGHSERVLAVAFSPDGRRIYSGAGDHSVRFWDATPLADTTVAELHILRGHTAPVSRVAWSPDGKYVASGGLDGDVRLWDPEAGLAIRTVRGHKGGSVLAIQFSPDGGRLAAVGLVDDPQLPDYLGQLKIWHVADGRELLAVRPDDLPPLHAAAFLPEGTSLALTTDSEEKLFIVDAATGVPLQASPTEVASVPSAVVRLVVDPCGRYLAAGTLDGYVLVWDVSNKPDPRPATLLFGLLPAAQGLVSVLGQMILARPRELPAHVSRVTGLTFSGDGRYLASAGMDNAMKLWDTATWQPLPDLPVPSGAIWDLAASPDGRHLASAGSDGTIRLWDLRKRTEQGALRGHTDTVSGIAFSPDGCRLASAGRDRTVRIWNVPKE